MYEIRWSVYDLDQGRYLTPSELRNWVSNYEQDSELQRRLTESTCARQEEDFDGVTLVSVVVENPNTGFDSAVMRTPCIEALPITTVANLWVGDLLDEVVANEILAGQNYTDKWLSVTGHVSHLGGAVWPRSGYEIEIGDIGGYDTKTSGSVYCYPQESQIELHTGLVKGDRITIQGIVEELEGSFLPSVRIGFCHIDDKRRQDFQP